MPFSLSRIVALATLCFVPQAASVAQPAPPGAQPLSSAQCATYQDVMREAAALQRARRSRDALALLTAYENEFAGDPYFDYQLGVAALDAAQPSVAQQALERAVLVRPDFAGAWIDLALAHARLGEAETALQIVAHIEDSFEVPLPLRDQLQSLRAELAAPRLSTEWAANSLLGARSGYLQFSAGHESNANLGLAASVFSLTQIGAPPLQIQIPPSARAASDAYSQVRGEMQQVLQFGEQQKGRIYLSGQHKEFADLKEYSLSDVAMSYTQEFALPNASKWAIEGLLGVRPIFIGGNRLATISSFGAGLLAHGSQCRWGVRAWSEIRDYGMGGYVDADVPTISLSTTCRRSANQISLVASWASDMPRSARAGGRTDRYELGMNYMLQVTPRVIISASGALGYYLDESGYSPLLKNGDIRHVARASARMSMYWEFDRTRPDWVLYAEIERLQDRSNLELFNVTNTRLAVGLRHQY